MVKLVSRWLTKRPWILLGDGAYSCRELVQTCIQQGVILISRLRLDAQLFEKPEGKKPGERGRKRLKGDRINLKALLQDSQASWQLLSVKWYGGVERMVECLSFEETRAHLGVETQRQCSDKAIERSTPLLMGLYSLITLIAQAMHEKTPLQAQEKTSWYTKNDELTFADAISAVRCSIWKEKYFLKSSKNHDFKKFSLQYLSSLIEQLALAG